jgi:hypothetical protein
MPACHLRHHRARRKRFRDDPPLVRVTPPSPATNATANLDAPSRRGSVNYMVDHICEPMPSTGSHLPNYAARCGMGGKTPLTTHLLVGEKLGQSVLREHRRHPYRIVHAQTDEPAIEQIVMQLLH